MNHELLQQTIDTIGYYASVCGEDDQDTPAKETIRALRSELAKPEPKPSAWLDPWTGKNATTDYDAYGRHGIPLFTKEQL